MKQAPYTPSQSSVWNLSALALRWPQVSIFFIAVIAIAGAMSYFKLGQREDPDFTFRAMVIRSIWPGASAEQTDQQVTDRIEKKLQEIPYFKHTRSYSRAGESLIVLELLDTAPAAEVPQIWYQVRKKIGDLKGQLPADVVGPFFNDEFGDVFGSIWAFTGDGLSLAELKRHVEQVRQNLLRIPDVSKIELIGVQDEKIYIEVSSSKLAALGLDPGQPQGWSTGLNCRFLYESVVGLSPLIRFQSYRFLSTAAACNYRTSHGFIGPTKTRRFIRCATAAKKRSGLLYRWFDVVMF
jgi:hypothetical protein